MDGFFHGIDRREIDGLVGGKHHGEFIVWVTKGISIHVLTSE